MSVQYNTKSAGVKRLMKEASELREPTEMYWAQPTEDNLFEWHFTVRGPLDSDYEGGIYHGRIIFPPEYPMKPPNLILLTPNGRFATNTKICLSISGYHPETWLPSWSIRTALLALIGFMPTAGAGSLGSVEYPPEERKKLAKRSGEWECSVCKIKMKNILKPLTQQSSSTNKEAAELASQLKFQNEADNKKSIAEANAVGVQSTSTSQDLPPSSTPTNLVLPAPVVGSEVVTPSSRATDTATPSVAASSESRPAAASGMSFSASSSTTPVDNSRNVTVDCQLFVTIPICVVFLSLFCLLFARRFLSA